MKQRRENWKMERILNKIQKKLKVSRTLLIQDFIKLPEYLELFGLRISYVEVQVEEQKKQHKTYFESVLTIAD